MATRTVIFADNPVLRLKAHKLARITRATQTLIDDMIDTMRAENGVGLAATQVAVSERLIVVEPPPDERDGEGVEPLYAVINPEIIKVSSEMEEGVEGCLSVPGWNGMVDRHAAIVVKGLDREGQPVRYKLAGYVARIFQHEIDHLDGILFIDRVADPADRRKLWRTNEPVEGEQPGPGEAAEDAAPVPAATFADQP